MERKSRLYLAVLFALGLVVSSVPAFGQTAQESVAVVQGFSSPSSALANYPSGVFGARASILPQRMMPSYDPWIGTYDRASYLVVRQATPSESGVSVGESSGLPPTNGVIGNSFWFLANYTVASFGSLSAAQSFYASLDSRQLATAYFHSTVSSTQNSGWIVVYQPLLQHPIF